MDNVMTVLELMEELAGMPPDAPVLVTIVKYPHEGMLKNMDDWDANWDEGDDVEVVPIELTYEKNGIVHICSEITDYSEERREYLET